MLSIEFGYHDDEICRLNIEFKFTTPILRRTKKMKWHTILCTVTVKVKPKNKKIKRKGIYHQKNCERKT